MNVKHDFSDLLFEGIHFITIVSASYSTCLLYTALSLFTAIWLRVPQHLHHKTISVFCFPWGLLLNHANLHRIETRHTRVSSRKSDWIIQEIGGKEVFKTYLYLKAKYLPIFGGCPDWKLLNFNYSISWFSLS